MQVQGSNISKQEDAFEFKLLQQFGLIPRAPPGQAGVDPESCGGRCELLMT